jgi:hypothetical protein
MAKLDKASDRVIDFIEDIINNETVLERYITWKILAVDKQKELIKISKASATVEYLAKCTDCIVIYVNEHMFDLMAPDNVNDVDLRKLLIKDALSMVNVVENENTGTMKIKIEKPQICVSIDGYRSMGQDLVRASELQSIIVKKAEQDEKERKEREKLDKQSKKKNG